MYIIHRILVVIAVPFLLMFLFGTMLAMVYIMFYQENMSTALHSVVQNGFTFTLMVCTYIISLVVLVFTVDEIVPAELKPKKVVVTNSPNGASTHSSVHIN